MKMDYIDISGITHQYNLPKCPYNYPCKETCETYNLRIPKSKPDIDTILHLFIDTSIEKSNILYTPMENKLIIYGNIHFKILYASKASCQSVHSAHFDIPFSTFILSSNICNHIGDTTLFIEDVFVKQFDSRNFYVSTLMLVYPELNKQKNRHNNNFYNKKLNYSNDNCNFDSDYYMQSSTSGSNFNDIHLEQNHYDNYNIDQSNSSDTKCNIEYENEYNIKSDNEYDNEYDIEYDIQYDMTPSMDTNITNNKVTEYKIGSDIQFDIEIDNDTDTNINLEIGNEYFEYEWE